MQLGRYLNFFMGSAKMAEMKMVVAEGRAASSQREACEIEVWVLEIEQKFRWQKKCIDAIVDEAESLSKRFKEAGEWLALMRKWMIDTCKQEVQVIEKS